MESVKLCPECFEDWKSGLIKFNRPLEIILVNDIDDCDMKFEG